MKSAVKGDSREKIWGIKSSLIFTEITDMTVNFDTLSGFNYSPYTSVLTQPLIGISENTLQAGDIRSEALGPKECKT